LADFTETLVTEDFEVIGRGNQRPYLVVLKGAHVGHTFRVDGTSMVIGRDEGVDIALLDGRISRRHARICVDDDGCLLEDLDSRNGTFLNGERLTAPRRVREGDKIYLGSTCVMKIMISSSAGSMKNEVVAAPPQLNSPGLPAISVCAGFMVTAKPSPKPMPL